MRVLTLHAPAFILAIAAAGFALSAAAQTIQDRPVAETRRHDDPQWLLVRDHLPDPATASAAALENQGDLLRIRRFPEDAMDYYGYALKHGGNQAELLNKIGLTEMELHNISLAEAYFRQVIKIDRRNSHAWNNLAATEYLQREYGGAVSDYKKAVKLESSTAVFHANLSTAYFETKDYKHARIQANDAMKLDPMVFQHSSGAGVAAHPLAVEDRARFSFEMARLYAQHNQEEEMLHALAVASENGFDIAANMAKDAIFAKYAGDERIKLLIVTAESLRKPPPSVIASVAVGHAKLQPMPAGR